MVTIEALRQIMPHAKSKVFAFAEPLNDAMDEFQINTPQRQAAFLAQVAHECGEFRYLEEIASGAAYDVGALAVRLGNTPEDDGDGERYKGRGLIQITGRYNYVRCGAALGLDLLADPELLESPANASRSAAWFWSDCGLNELADAGNFRKITLKINGGLNGYADRLKYWERAKEAIA